MVRYSTICCVRRMGGHKKIWRVNRVKESMVKREGEAKGEELKNSAPVACFGTRDVLTVESGNSNLCKSTTQTRGGSYCAERASFWQRYRVADQCYTPPNSTNCQLLIDSCRLTIAHCPSSILPCLLQTLHQPTGVLWRNTRINTKD